MARECVTPRGGVDTKNPQAAQCNAKENKTPGEMTLSVNDKVLKRKGVPWNSVCGTILGVGARGTSSLYHLRGKTQMPCTSPQEWCLWQNQLEITSSWRTLRTAKPWREGVSSRGHTWLGSSHTKGRGRVIQGWWGEGAEKSLGRKLPSMLTWSTDPKQITEGLKS